MTSFLLVLFLLGQCFVFLHVKFRMKKLFLIKRIIYNKLVIKHSDWPVVKNEENSICISIGCHLVETFSWCDLVFYCWFFLFSFFFGPWFLSFFLYFGRKIISVWGHLVVFLFCRMIQKVLDVFWWIVILRISVLFARFLVTSERVNCIGQLNPFNLFIYYFIKYLLINANIARIIQI